MSVVPVEDPPRSRIASAGLGAIGFTAVLWAVQLVNGFDHQGLDTFGVEPRSGHGLLGIVFAPLLHASWGHLGSNTLPVLVLLFLVLISGIGRGTAATAVIWLTAGVGVWLLGPSNSDEVGASVLVFGWLVYLIARGVFTRRLREIALGVVVLIIFGAVLLGVLPGQPGISWQGHLFGAIGGALAAWVLSDRRERVPEIG